MSDCPDAGARDPARRAALAGHMAMLCFSALVSGSFSLGALAAPLIDPGALTAARFLIAGLVVGALAGTMRVLDRRHLAAPWRYGVLGALLAGYFVLMFEALQTATPVSAAAVFTLTPLLAAGFAWPILRQGLTPRLALALGIGALGAAWIVFRGDLGAAMSLSVGQGETIYFLGCVAHALYTPIVRRLNRGEPALAFTFLTMVAGALVVALWSWQAILATPWPDLPPLVWLVLAYLALAASAASFVLLQFASLRLPAAKVMAYTYLTPAWVILWEWALQSGLPDAATLAGLLPIGLGLWLLLEKDPVPFTGSKP